MDKPTETTQATEPQKVGSTEGVKRKIAGKFDSLEEAVEQGYVGLEKKLQENNEKLAAVTKLLEDALTPDPTGAATVQVGTTGGRDSDDPYGRGEEFKIDPAQFLADPGKTIKQVEDRAYGRAMRASAELIANSMVVQEFRSQNRDLIPHEQLVASFMGKTDPKKPLGERLEDAATKTRAYLAKLKAEWTGDSRTPSTDEYVEGPGGTRTPAPKGDEGEKDETLENYVKERHMAKASHFGAVTKK